MVPTYLFIFSLLAAVGIGVFKSITSGGHPCRGNSSARSSSCRGRHRRVAPVAILRQRLYGDDRGRSGEQRSDGVQRAGDQDGAAHVDHHHRAADRDARRHRFSGARVSHRRNGSRRRRLPERHFDDYRRGSRARPAVLHRDWFRPGGSGSVGQHGVRRFSAPVPGHRVEWIPARRVQSARAPPGLFPGRLGAGRAGRDAADCVSRRHQPADSTLCGWRISGVHACPKPEWWRTGCESKDRATADTS